MSYCICSLNVLRSARGDEKDRDFYEFINSLIATEGIDIFAIQEAKDINFINNLRRNLPSFWMGEALYNSELAFIWNSNRVRVKEDSRPHESRVFDNYSSKIRLTREPAVGWFVPADLKINMEFRLINIHLFHGGNENKVTIDKRKIECGLAKGVIYKAVDKPSIGNDGNFNRVFTVVLGDYNLDCDVCNTCGPENIRTFQELETTLKKEEPLGYKSSYDHFSYDAVRDASVPRNPPSRIDAVKDYFGGKYAQYREQVSDHIPVKLEIF